MIFKMTTLCHANPINSFWFPFWKIISFKKLYRLQHKYNVNNKMHNLNSIFHLKYRKIFFLFRKKKNMTVSWHFINELQNSIWMQINDKDKTKSRLTIILRLILKLNLCIFWWCFTCICRRYMLFCDMRSGKFNSPLMAQLLSVLTNITQVRLEKVMARATTKCTVKEQKKSTLFTMILVHSYLRVLSLCCSDMRYYLWISHQLTLQSIFWTIRFSPMNKLIDSQALQLLLKLYYEVIYELGLYRIGLK